MKVLGAYAFDIALAGVLSWALRLNFVELLALTALYQVNMIRYQD